MEDIDFCNLTLHLKKNESHAELSLTFDEIENIINNPLSRSFRIHPMYWRNSKNYSLSEAWLSAGYKTINVSKTIVNNQIIFQKIEKNNNLLNSILNNILKKHVTEIMFFSFIILVVLSSYYLNDEHNLFFGIVSMISLLISTAVFIAIKLQCAEKNNNKILFFNKTNLLYKLVSGILYIMIISYIRPLFIPGEYTIWCINFTYTGYVRNQNANGMGKLSIWNGDVVEGTFEMGTINGYGQYQYMNGDIYEGNFVRNKMHGEGVYKFSNGVVYTGSFIRGDITGTGEILLNTGEIYSGEVVNGQRSGRGILKTTNGSSYDGEWIDDAKHGNGVMNFPNGDSYEGVWENNFIKHGSKVKHTYNDGRVVERYMYAFLVLGKLNYEISKIEKIEDGDSNLFDEFEKYDQENFKPNILHGNNTNNDEESIFIFQDLNNDCLNGYYEVVFLGDNSYGLGGTQYSGDFYNGTFHGKGTMYITDGNSNVVQTYSGDFIDGLFHGYGVMTSNDGDRFEGEFLYGEPDGFGTYYHENGIVEKGVWKKNWELTGYGSTQIDGVTYEGTWKSGYLVGEGYIIDPNGAITSGTWSME